MHDRSDEWQARAMLARVQARNVTPRQRDRSRLIRMPPDNIRHDNAETPFRGKRARSSRDINSNNIIIPRFGVKSRDANPERRDTYILLRAGLSLCCLSRSAQHPPRETRYDGFEESRAIARLSHATRRSLSRRRENQMFTGGESNIFVSGINAH